MPDQFKDLAAYNARVAQGIVHEPAYVAHMAQLQWEFEEWADSVMPGRRSRREARMPIVTETSTEEKS